MISDSDRYANQYHCTIGYMGIHIIWYQPLPLPPPRSPSRRVRAVRAVRAGDTAATPHGAAACAGNGADARQMD